MADVKQAQQMIPFIACEIPFGQNVCELVWLVSMYLIWIFGSKLILSNNQVKSNSVGSGDVSHCWTSSFDNHFNYSFIVLKHDTIKLLDARIGHWKEQHQCLSSCRFSYETCGGL